MEICRTHKLIRFAFFLDDYPPHSTTLCALFWRIVVMSTVTLFCALVLSSFLLLVYIITPFYPGFLYTLLGFGTLMYYMNKWYGETMLYYGIKNKGFKADDFFYWIGDRVNNQIEPFFERIGNSLFWKMLCAMKEKACPIIKIKYE